MRASGVKFLSVVMAMAVLAACGSDNPRLLNIAASSEGPDEFAILPTKPLQQPPSFSTLPPPTPGRANRADINPDVEAVAALGGNPAAVVARGGVPAADLGLIRHASRYGRDAGIRTRLAQEDLAFRQRKDGRLLERLFNVNVYFRAYQPQSLNKYAELERWRRLGVRTPSAPPEEVELGR